MITLTTDFGPKDYYVGAFKGALLSRMPALRIIDISHQINPYDIINAAYVIKRCYLSFPKDTVHLICVNNNETVKDYLIVQSKGQWLLAPDNGLLSLVIESEFEASYRLDMSDVNWLNFYDQLAKRVTDIMANWSLLPTLPEIDSYRKALSLQPVSTENEIKGTIIHVDTYGNLVSNIHQLFFEQICQSRPFCIYLKPNLTLKRIESSLENTIIGGPFAIYNAPGYLTFGICMGDAAQMYDLGAGVIFQIQFLV